MEGVENQREESVRQLSMLLLTQQEYGREAEFWCQILLVPA